MIYETIIKEGYPTFSSSILFITSMFFCYQIGKYHRTCIQKEIKIYKTSHELENETHKFLALFSEKNEHFVNSNIHPDLYCYETYIALQKMPHSDESIWKSRKLVQHTPQGNVVMFYDLYKQAFAYVSDTQLSYKWLNACAMKYVRLFLCRDFFRDTQYIPPNHENPFHTMEKMEKKQETDKKRSKREKLNVDLQSDVFLKKPNTTTTTNNTTTTTNKNIEQKKHIIKGHVEETIVNNFQSIGNIRNHSVLQSAIYTQSNNNPITQNYQYVEFKKMLNKKINTNE